MNNVESGWMPCKSMPSARTLFAMVAFDGAIYAIGGVVNGAVVASVDRYQIAQNMWSSEASMRIPRSAAAAVVLNKQIFVLGGATKMNTAETTTVERFDGQSWTMVT